MWILVLLERCLNATLALAPFLLVGLLLAGVAHVLVRASTVRRYLGGTGLAAVVRAALFGAPLPVCSCGVVPLAVALSRKGASRPSTLSVLITTPESSADSMLLTWGVLGPVMAFARLVASLFTAVLTGVLAIASGLHRSEPIESGEEESHSCSSHHAGTASSEEGDGVGLRAVVRALRYEIDRRYRDVSEPAPEPPADATLAVLTKRALRYGFVTVVDDLAFWLVIGLVLTGLVEALVPGDLAPATVSGGLFAMFIVLVASVPLYVCASSSTPVAAALVAKGVSPGTALVFLLAGPATNAASVVAISGVFGRRFTRVYLLGIVVGAVVSGLALDMLLATTGLEIVSRLTSAGVQAHGPLSWLSALVLAALLGWRLYAGAWSAGVATLTRSAKACRRLVGFDTMPTLRRALPILAAVLLLVWIGSGVVTVPPGHVGFVTVLGALSEEIREPGIHWHPPAPFGSWKLRHVEYPRKSDVGYKTDLEQIPRRAELAASASPDRWHSPVFAMNRRAFETLFISGDEKLVEMSFSVTWSLSDPEAFFYKLAHDQDTVGLYARAAAQEFLASRPLDALLTTERAESERQIASAARQKLDALGLGIVVERVHIVDLHPPEATVWVFRDVSSAREERETRVHEARQVAAGAQPRARGEAAALVAEATSDGRARVLEAQGAAAAFSAKARSAARHPQLVKHESWLAAAERCLPGRTKYLLPRDGEVRSVGFWEPKAPEAARRERSTTTEETRR